MRRVYPAREPQTSYKIAFYERASAHCFYCSKKKVKAENGTQNLIIQGKKCDKGYVTQRRRV
ncbi:hypothetical protein DJ534_07070 [Enterobacter hormaechei]|nr:hypothetical protein AM401_17120 [Enterobacter cloacae complex sp.]AWV78297.1 hypothetical protein DN066_24125 [Enterobacter hormaechei subsp. xiangfangensis]AXO45015.1 hypothetical protein AXA59_09730 [Enterobacter hormaechei]PNY62868.1 hypothetical protein C2M14_08845 [Enterobacter cloacae]POV14460.1 hypothetical protein C3371_13205 [Enterobacter cloacae complex sp. ECNIH13]POV64633.1 hypothetical protein C3390_14565 [Enterobacter cloacae complex sp. ECNIH15]